MYIFLSITIYYYLLLFTIITITIYYYYFSLIYDGDTTVIINHPRKINAPRRADA